MRLLFVDKALLVGMIDFFTIKGVIKMTIPLSSALILLLAHFVGDFLFQTDWMATNKSSRLDALFAHVGMYTLTLAFIGMFAFPGLEAESELVAVSILLQFVFLNGFLHLVIDFFTSKAAAFHHQQGHRAIFFKIIGADQMFHVICLLWTAAYFLG